ncbi:hypothetical protein [Polaromonas sp. OV174]|uniref:hypothetical protein n=1 Tax=Polaromonas sp. OV174 TaxID=1855300 RepID=UPI0015A5A379|nr:hypothetical protein [Polaromonas sp. OV174]
MPISKSISIPAITSNVVGFQATLQLLHPQGLDLLVTPSRTPVSDWNSGISRENDFQESLQ